LQITILKCSCWTGAKAIKLAYNCIVSVLFGSLDHDASKGSA
jgi:hypothetical protein